MARMFSLFVFILFINCNTCSSSANRNTASSRDGPKSQSKSSFNDQFVLKVKSDELDEDGRLQMFMDTSKTVTFRIIYSCSNDSIVTVYVDSFENRDVVKTEPLMVTFDNNDGDFFLDNFTFHNLTSPGVSKSQIGSEKNSQNDKILAKGQLCSREVKVTIESELIGISSLAFTATIGNNSLEEVKAENVEKTVTSVTVLVLREIGFIDTVFLICVYVLEITEMLTFGSQLDLYVVKHTLKKPVAPLIGLVCQYVGMPLIAYGVAKAVASDSLAAVGIFVAGICPGGGSSNIYAYLLDGDLSLSITMTTASTILSLGMMPLWIYTLGKEFYQEYDVDIPYIDIVVSLSVIFVPLSVGLFIKSKFPKLAKYIEKITTILVIFLAILLIVTGVYSSLYIFRLFSLQIVLIGCALPYVGFILGGIMAFVCRQSWEHIKTIAIETGMQNTGIAIILLYNSFPDPLGDLSSVAPISAEVMSPIPPLVFSIIYLIRKKCCTKYDKVCKKEDDRKYEVEMNQKTLPTKEEYTVNKS